MQRQLSGSQVASYDRLTKKIRMWIRGRDVRIKERVVSSVRAAVVWTWCRFDVDVEQQDNATGRLGLDLAVNYVNGARTRPSLMPAL